MNWVIIIVVGILAIALIVFFVTRKQKDEKKFEKELNNDYAKPMNEERDIEIDELTDSIH